MSSVSNGFQDGHSLEDTSSSLLPKIDSALTPHPALEKQVGESPPTGFPFSVPPPPFHAQSRIKEEVDNPFVRGPRLETKTACSTEFRSSGAQANKLEESKVFQPSIQPPPDLHSPSGSGSGSQLVTLSPIRKSPQLNMDNMPTAHTSMAVSPETSTSSDPQNLNTSTPPGTGQLSISTKRKRNLPGTPDPDAEVVALSPKTLMATNRFVCEICNKGFQRDQNLQLHRRGHNLPWKLRQRSSKEVKKRVYICPEPTCVHHDPSRALGDLTGIKKHFCRKHGEKKFKCDKCSKRYAVQSDWKAHLKTCGTREYRCDCGTLFSRRDSFITHRAFCDALTDSGAGSLPTLPSNQMKGDQNAQVGPSSSLQAVKSQLSDIQSPNSGSGNQGILSPESMSLPLQQRWMHQSQNSSQPSENELNQGGNLPRSNPRLGLCLGSGSGSQGQAGQLNSQQASLNQNNPLQNNFSGTMNPLSMFDPNNLSSALLYQYSQQRHQQQQQQQQQLLQQQQQQSSKQQGLGGGANQLSNYSDISILRGSQNSSNDFNLQSSSGGIFGNFFNTPGSFQNFAGLGPNSNLSEILQNVPANRLNMGVKIENNSQDNSMSGSVSGNFLSNLSDQTLSNLRNPGGNALQTLTEQLFSQGNGQQISAESMLQRQNQLRNQSSMNQNQMKNSLGVNSDPTGGLAALGGVWPSQNMNHVSVQGQPQGQNQNQNHGAIQDQNQNRGMQSVKFSGLSGNPLIPMGGQLLSHQKSAGLSHQNQILNQFNHNSLSEGVRPNEGNTNSSNQGLQEFFNMAAGNQGMFGAGGLASMFGSNAGSMLTNLNPGNELIGQGGDTNALQSMAASMQNLSRGSGEDLKSLNVVTRDFLGLARTISPRDFSQIRDLAALNASMEANNNNNNNSSSTNNTNNTNNTNSNNLDKQPQREILNNANNTSGV